jgi:hypothetical protein
VQRSFEAGSQAQAAQAACAFPLVLSRRYLGKNTAPESVFRNAAIACKRIMRKNLGNSANHASKFD